MDRKLKPLYFFGDFDPINQGLLALAKQEHERTLRPIVFAPLPAEKTDRYDASDEDRLAMLKLAIEGEPFSSIDSSYIHKDEADIYLEMSFRFPANRRPFMSDEDFSERTEICLDPDAVSCKRIPLKERDCRNASSFIALDAVRDYIERKRLYYVGRLSEAIKSAHRLEHSISVAHLCYDIALSNDYPNPEDAYFAGLFHDCGKHCDEERSLRIMKRYFADKVPFPEWTYHQFVGCFLAAAEFKVGNSSVWTAIAEHATGAPSMSALSQIVYAADKIDPLRGYDSSALIKKCKEDLRKGFLAVLKENRKYLTEKGYKVDNPMTKACFGYYLGDKGK